MTEEKNQTAPDMTEEQIPAEETAAEERAPEENAAEEPVKEGKDKKNETKKLKAEVEQMKKSLADAEKQKAETEDKYLRVMAEYDNFRKRSAAERKSVYGDAVADTLTGLLPIIDNLEIASKYSGGDSEKVAEGVTMILSKLPDTLEKLNIKAFGQPGDTFDPAFHNAVMHVEDEEHGEGEIVEVLQTGYLYGDKVIRYAMVKVAN